MTIFSRSSTERDYAVSVGRCFFVRGEICVAVLGENHQHKPVPRKIEFSNFGSTTQYGQNRIPYIT